MATRKSGTIRRLTNIIPPSDKRMAAWWYGRVFPNNRDHSQPHVEVLFREIDTHGTLNNLNLKTLVNISALGQVPLGSIWQKGRDVGTTPLERRQFEVDFSSGKWEMIRALQQDAPDRYTVPPFVHPLLSGFSQPMVDSWLVRFKTRTGGHLTIPAIEYFLRAYGKSSELHRILLTYPWSEASKRLYGTHQPTPDPNVSHPRWTVHLGPHLQIEDALFLGHVLHNERTLALAKGLWGQIASNSGDGTHLRIEPWHQGKGRIEVLGKSLGRNGFLALRIVGMTPPSHPPIEVVRLHTEATEAGVDDANVALVRHQATTNEEMPLLDDQPPDHGMGYVELEDPTFEWLDRRPNIQVKHQTETSPNNHPTLINNEVDRLSAGDAAGAPKGVGKLSAHTPITLETRGTLRDMWDTFLYLRKNHPDKILEVGWMDWDGDTHHGDEPHLCPFPPPEESAPPPSWLVIGEQSPHPRGILLIKVRTIQGTAIIMEIEREQDPKNVGQEKDSYKGLATRVGEDTAKTMDWLKGLATILPSRHGVFPRRLNGCPTIAGTFKHRRSEMASLRENTAWLALGKAGCL